MDLPPAQIEPNGSGRHCLASFAANVEGRVLSFVDAYLFHLINPNNCVFFWSLRHKNTNKFPPICLETVTCSLSHLLLSA